jgi:hypothetical protein
MIQVGSESLDKSLIWKTEFSTSNKDSVSVEGRHSLEKANEETKGIESSI